MPQGTDLNRFAARGKSLIGRKRGAADNRGPPRDGLVTRRGEGYALGAAIFADEALGVAGDPDAQYSVKGLERVRRAYRINGVRTKFMGDLVRQGNTIANTCNPAGRPADGGDGANPSGRTIRLSLYSSHAGRGNRASRRGDEGRMFETARSGG